MEYTNARLNFSTWSMAFKFEPGELNGINSNDFRLVYDKIRQIKGFKTQQQAIDWLKAKEVILHHYSATEIQLFKFETPKEKLDKIKVWLDDDFFKD